MSNIICFVMVAIAYALGHVGGYRLCKFRIKNNLIKRMHNAETPAAWKDLYAKALHEIIIQL